MVSTVTNVTYGCTERYLHCWQHTCTVNQCTEAWMRDVDGDVRWRCMRWSLVGVFVTVDVTQNL